MNDLTKKEENVLDKETIKKIKTDLLTRKKQILKDFQEITGNKNNRDSNNHKVKFPEYGNKSDENAQEIGDYTTNLATEKVLDSTLRDINSSLKRIEKGTYGICKYCHKSIGKKRMLARPVASACIPCKTKLQNQR